MIITIDGYDGTGKTTLAKKLANKYGFEFMDKPFIHKLQHENSCSFSQAVIMAKEQENQLYKNYSRRDLVNFYCSAIQWVAEYAKDKNIVLDRGILTTYAVFGDEETVDLFDQYIQGEAFHYASIYLTATDLERRRRIYENDPNDPDLKYPIEWRKTDLLEFSESRKLNMYKINTNDKTPDEVFSEVSNLFENTFNINNPTL